jgi:peptidyl-prolyl cis-trans isomerase C
MRHSRAVGLGALLAVEFYGGVQLAESDSHARVVVTVDATRLTVGDIERRLAQLPDYQLATVGDDPAQIRERFVRDFLVVELFYAAEARRLKLEREPAVRARLDDVLRHAVEQDLREKLDRDQPVTDEQVRRYYVANQARFQTPRRIRIWRILVDDRQLALRIIDEAEGTGGPERWAQLAREHSLDTATRVRRGDLGFVRQDGRTDTPSVRVEPGLFAAADRVADGQLVAEPVPEGKLFAVVWRRGSLPAVSRTLEQEAGSIRRMLVRSRLRDAVDALVQKLRRRHVRVVDESLLRHVEVPPLQFRAQPGSTHRPAAAAANSAPPRPSQRGLR